MIHIFRKEMKRWNGVLWLVFFALLFGSGVSFFRQKGLHELPIGSVNGNKIFYMSYYRALNGLKEKLSEIGENARRYGLPAEFFYANFLGGRRPEDIALDKCIQERILDQVVDNFNVRIAKDVFKLELAKSMPKELVDENGYINMDIYQSFLSRMSMMPRDFEELRYKEMRREVADYILSNAFYVPSFSVKEEYMEGNVKKSFAYVHLPIGRFMDEVEKKPVNENGLLEYYNENKEMYRVPEMRQARYWVASSDDYSKKVSIDDESIQNYYDRNKGSEFRVPPKLKVRKILFTTKDGGTLAAAKKRAQQVLSQAKKNPESFAELAKTHSDDKESAKVGGLVDFFSRNAYEKEFEDAAFKLMEPLQMSPVVKTSKGYEIIQLVERKKAYEMPLEYVKDQIVEKLKIKKAINTLRSDLEVMMHDARKDIAALESFVKDRKLVERISDWFTDKDKSKSGVEGALATRLFKTSNRQQSYGYFLEDGKYVVYQLSGTRASNIPALDKIKETVTKDYKKKTAKLDMNKFIADVKSDIFDKKISLFDVAEKYNLVVNKTGMISRENPKIDGVDNSNQFISESFVLSDECQILQYRHNEDCYLTQLIEAEQMSEEGYNKKKYGIVKRQKKNEKGANFTAFIESLHRNAKISIDTEILNKTMQMRE